MTVLGAAWYPEAPAWRSRPAGQASSIARVARAAGLSVPRLLADVAQLAAGTGRIDLSDYERMRLYDADIWAGADRRRVVGRARGASLARFANFRRDWRGMASDRIAVGAYLAAHGLAVARPAAIFRDGLAASGEGVLRTREELREFLRAREGAPTLVSSADGVVSRLISCDDGSDPERSLDRLLEEIGDRPGASWTAEDLPTAHREGPRDPFGRPAPVRVLTLSCEAGARVARAYWPLGGRHDAVASLDLKTGEASRVFAAAAPERARSAPQGLAAPDWRRLKALAAEAARVLWPFGMLAFDIAPTAKGPMILRLDAAPTLDLFQLADRRGLLTPEFEAFLAERRQARSRSAC